MAKKPKTKKPATAEDLELSKRVLRLIDPRSFVHTITASWWSPAVKAMPSLLMGLYVAEQEGRLVSKKAACDLMDVDVATTGPKYLDEAVENGLIVMERDEASDKRKIFVKLTRDTKAMLDREMEALKTGKRSAFD